MPAYRLYSTEVGDELNNLLALGCSIADACAQVGITDRTFYHWRSEGRKQVKRLEDDPSVLLNENERALVQFFQSSIRAQGRAKVAAVGAIRTALTGGEEITESVETTTVTRLRTVKTEKIVTIKGKPVKTVVTEQVPYELTTTVKRRSTRKLAPDAHAAITFLARRDPDHWAEHKFIELDARQKLLAQIREQQVDFALLVELFDEDEAAALFTDAGLPVPNWQLNQGDE
jgi:hypothetical protein